LGGSPEITVSVLTITAGCSPMSTSLARRFGPWRDRAATTNPSQNDAVTRKLEQESGELLGFDVVDTTQSPNGSTNL
jgi:hypothetical protein